MTFILWLITRVPVKYRWWVFVASASISCLAFFHIHSYFADKHGLNWLMWVVGIVFGLFTAGVFKLAADESKHYDD